jgi:tRNA A-37 threonylcarbamoyl transferase component Bud32
LTAPPNGINPQTRLTKSTKIIQNPAIRFSAKIVFGIVLVASLLVTYYESGLILDYYTSQSFALAFTELNISARGFAFYMITWRVIRMLVFIGAASFIFSRRSDTRIGIATSLWLLVMGVTNSTALISVNVYLLTKTSQVLADSSVITLEYLGAFGSIWLTWAGWTFIMAILLIYPNGKIEPRWSWAIIISWIFISSLWSVLPLDSHFHPLMWNFYLRSAIIAGLWIALIYTLTLRYRRYFTKIERQQAKWVFYWVVLYAITYFSYIIIRELLQSTPLDTPHLILSDGTGIIIETSVIGTVISIAVSLFRYRLWDIDLVINRSLVYGAILTILSVIFFAALLGLQLIGSTNPLLAVSISLGATALLYQQTKRHVQDFVDHRIYGLRIGLNAVNQLKDISKPPIETIGQLTGHQFGGYELLDLLGKGGMGTVYKAYLAGETLAIKILNTDISMDADMRRRFEREAAVGMSLQHPNIVNIKRISEQDNHYYMVMEYIDGQDLRQYMKQKGALDVKTAIAIITALCDGLKAAHQANYVHRDIKPANIMLRKDGSPVLMDFGIAKLRDGHTAITKTGAMGTIDYMAPEQIISAKEVDARADIYGLAVMLYEMLAGHPPFKGSAAQLLFAHIQQPAPYLQEELPDIPLHIATSIMRAMSKDPDDRQQTVTAFSESLSY